MKRSRVLFRVALTVLVGALFTLPVTPAEAQTKKPNILVIWGDDIGQSNIRLTPWAWLAIARRISTGLPRRA